MILSIFTVILLLITPAIIVKTLTKFKFLQFFGPVFYCYLFGIVVTNLLSVVNLPINKDLSFVITNIAQIFVLIAIVQMLLSTQFKDLIKLSKVGLLGFTLAALSVFISCFLSLKTITIFFPQVTHLEIKHLLSMAVGVYTGGTANMAVLSQTLKVSPELFLQAYSTDLVLSGILLILLMNFIPWIFSFVLKSFDYSSFEEHQFENQEQHLFPYPEIYKLKIIQIIKKSLITLFIIAVSLGISFIIQKITPFQFDQIALFTITTLSILISFSGKISIVDQNDYFILGDYNLLIFCLSMGTLANLNQLQSLPLWVIFGLLFVLILSTLLHLILSYFFKIDRDVSIITLTASIFGPPFVICTSQALKNKHVITTGIGTGLIGMAIGTYLGLIFFNLF